MFSRIVILCFAILTFAHQDTAAGCERVSSERFADVKERVAASVYVRDRSTYSKIIMRTPTLGFVNITGCDSLPVKFSDTLRVKVEYVDEGGLYFEKTAVVTLQGGYSTRFPKRNFSCKFTNGEWDEDNTTAITVGKWVAQDEFHFKAFYTDMLRGFGEVGYKVYEDMTADQRDFWQRGGYAKESTARCFPDGFPCIVYVNGDFYGVFAWQLRKHRDNMNMKKHNAAHIHLDGSVCDEYLFGGYINWGMFEIRNPKTLYDNENFPYEKTSGTELIGEDSPFYNMPGDSEDVRKSKERSAKVKASIVALSRYCGELKALDSAGVDDATFKREFEKRFDKESLIDYAVFNRVTMNGDGTIKNFQWFTYDGVKWFVTPYDLDQTFGLNISGIYRPADFTTSDITTGPFLWLAKYYKEEERQRYIKLRTRGVIDIVNIARKFDTWYNRVGDYYYDLEKERWSDSPCFRDPICYKGWSPYDDYSKYDSVPNYNSKIDYSPGDLCILDGRIWQTSRYVQGIEPFSLNARKDSIERVRDWVDKRVVFLDNYYDYKVAEMTGVDKVSQTDAEATVVGIFGTAGDMRREMQQGLNIVKYSDGTCRKVYVER